MDTHQIAQLAYTAHHAALAAIDEPTTAVPLLKDSRYCHKWVPLDEQVVDEDGNVIDTEPVRAAAMHLAQEMIQEGVREFMPLELPKHEVIAFRVDDERLSVRVCAGYVLVPLDGKEPGYRLRVDIAGLKPSPPVTE